MNKPEQIYVVVDALSDSWLPRHTNSNLHSEWYRGFKDEAPEAYNQCIEDAEDAANNGDMMNVNWNNQEVHYPSR